MKSFLSYSIRIQLQIIFLLSLVPALGIILYDGLERRNHEITETRQETTALIDVIAAEQEAIAASTRQLLLALSALPQVRSRDAAACSKLFAELIQQNPQYVSIIGFDTQGNVFALSMPFSRPLDAGNRKYFRDAVQTRKFSVGEYVISKTTSKPVIHFSYPVLNEAGTLQAVLAVSVDLSYIRQSSIWSDMPKASTITLLDHRGIILHRVPDHETYAGKPENPDIFRMLSGANNEGTYTAVGLDGVSKLYAYRQVSLEEGSTPYLYVRAGIPEERAFSEARFILKRNLGLFALAALLGSAAAWFLGNKVIADRIQSLVSSTKRLGSGNLEAKIPHADIGGELGELAQAFDEMRSELAMREAERKKDEETIQRANQVLREILEKSPFGIYVVNHLGTIEYANEAMKEISGDSNREIVGINLAEFAPYKKAGISDLIHGALAGKPFYIGPVEYTSFFAHKTTIRNFTGIPFEEDGVKKVIVFVEDITDQTRTEEEKRSLQHQLLQAQKMESLGRLAGGIAHDFNNILSAIIGYSELALMKLPEDSPLRSQLNIIKEAGQRAAGLTYQLLAFGRKQILEIKPVNVNEVIESMFRMLSRLIGEDITLEIRPKKHLHNVMADRGQLEQIVMNLVVNARDAMPQGGTLVIETNELEYEVSYRAMRPGTYVTFSVRDTGLGMTKEVQERIFEPFFTTKELGKGTGLGLATVYGIVKQHDGYIYVSSELGKGSSFTVYLPATKKALDGFPVISNEPLPRGMETILIVDDDSAVRTLIVDTLSSLGYRTLHADSGQAALHIGESHQRPIHLLLTDVIMPKMNGKELAGRFRLLHPETRTLFISGYTDDKLATQGILEQEGHFLQKPVSLSTLAHKLRKILG